MLQPHWYNSVQYIGFRRFFLQWSLLAFIYVAFINIGISKLWKSLLLKLHVYCVEDHSTQNSFTEFQRVPMSWDVLVFVVVKSEHLGSRCCCISLVTFVWLFSNVCFQMKLLLSYILGRRPLKPHLRNIWSLLRKVSMFCAFTSPENFSAVMESPSLFLLLCR